MWNKFLFQMFLLISSVQFAYGVDEDYFIKSFYSLKVGQSVGPNLAFSFYNTDCSNEYGRTVVTNELDYTYDANDFSFSNPSCVSKDFFELSSLDCKLSQECQVNITVHPQTTGIKYARIDQTIKSTNTSISGEGGEVVSTNSYYQYFVYQYKVKTYEIDAYDVVAFKDFNIPKLQSIAQVKKEKLKQCGSIILPTNKVIGESIPLVGLKFNLNYFSHMTPGRVSDYRIVVPVNDEIALETIKEFKIIISDKENNVLQAAPLNYYLDPNYFYQWDGKVDGKYIWGTTLRKVKLKHKDSPTIEEVNPVIVGNFKAIKLGLGGFLPSNWSFYDNNVGKIYFGNGDTRDIKAISEGSLFRVADEDGNLVNYYDSIGRLVEVKRSLTGKKLFSFNYDPISTKLVSIFDEFNRETKIIHNTLEKKVIIISPENVKTILKLNDDGLLVSLINPKNEVYDISYHNALGLISTFKKPNGRISNFTFDFKGDLIEDSNNSLQKITLIDSNNGVISKSAEGRETKFNYNNETSTQTITSPSGLITNFTETDLIFNKINPISSFRNEYVTDPRFGGQAKLLNKSETTDFGGSSSQIDTSITLLNPSDSFSIDKINSVSINGNSEINSIYDGLTKTTTTTTKLGRTIASQIDDYERPILEQTGSILPIKYSYNQDKITSIAQGDRTTQFLYEPTTNLLSSVQNAEGQSIKFYYDEAQRLKAKELPDGRIIEMQYDSENNLVSITPPGRPAHKINYGLNESLSSYNPPTLTNVSNVNTLYSYNKDRDLTKITRPDGAVINFNHNAVSGLLDSVFGDFGSITYTYQNEQVKSIRDQNNQKATFNYNGTVVSQMNIFNKDNNEEYEFSRTPSTENPGSVGSESIKVKNVTQSINYEYDDDKLLTKAGDLYLNYNSPNGQLINTNLENIKEYYTYNKVGEIKSYTVKKVKHKKEVTLYSYRLERDKLGRIIKKLEEFNEESKEESHHNHEKNRNETEDKLFNQYVYDKAGRLVKVFGPRRNSFYRYDLNSNRIEGQAGKEEFDAIYDNQDRLIRFNDQTFSYSANGDLISIKELEKKHHRPNYKTTNVVYDVFGNLIQFGNITYQINPLGKRSARLVDGVITHKYYYTPEGLLIGVADKDGNLKKTFIYATKSHVPDYFVDEFNKRFKIVTDHLGSVRLVVNAKSGEVIQKMNHDEFGNVLFDSNPMLTPFGFAGGVYDNGTKLVRFGARDYDPKVGRWTSKDPIRFNGGDSNLYGYVLQDPVNGIDPKGLFAIGIEAQAIAFLGIFGGSSTSTLVLSVDLNPFSHNFLHTETGIINTGSRLHGLGAAATAGANGFLAFGNNNIADLTGISLGVSGGFGNFGGSASLSSSSLSFSFGLRGLPTQLYGAFSINATNASCNNK